MKKVTVVVPLYNAESYIAATIQSVLEQTYRNFELLIVDDGSTDRSISIVRQFTDARIQLIQQSNQGPAAARNRGIAAATGDYIALLDADDLWLPTKLAQHVDHLEADPQLGISFGPSLLINQTDQLLGLYQLPKLRNITTLDWLCRTPIGNGSVPVMRRAALDEIHFSTSVAGVKTPCYFNPDRQLHPSEDVECWLRVALLTRWKIEGIPQALTLYRIHSQGHSANLLKKLDSWQQMLAIVRSYAESEIAACQHAAMAYQLRHLARRAVTLRDGSMALRLMQRSLRVYPRILIEEPARTVQTLAAAYLLHWLPTQGYRCCEAVMMQLAGLLQKQQLRQSKVSQPVVSR